MLKAILPSAALLAIASGCATYNHELYQDVYGDVKAAAAKHAAQGDLAESAYLAKSLVAADPDDAEARKLLDDALNAAPESDNLVNKPWLGSNLSTRAVKPDFPIWGSILLYPFNRVFDTLDLLTVEVGPCLGVGVNASATEMVGVGAQLSAGETMIGLDRRHLSIRTTQDEFIEVMPLELRHLSEAKASTGGAYAVKTSTVGLKKPSQHLYQEARDYWAIGGRAEAGIFGANVELHPVELADWLGGFFFLDPLHDDLGKTRSLRLNEHELSNLQQLIRQTQLRDE